MNDKEKIEELENQIKFLKRQVSALKSAHRIDWAKYYMFGDGKYEGGLCADADSGVTERARLLALRIMSLYEKRVGDRLYVRSCNPPNARKLTVKQAEFANGFLDEIYPIVEKYAMIALNDKDNLQGEKAE